MPTEASSIPGVIIHRPQVHSDSRGRFVEIFRAVSMPEAFVQSNHSTSVAGVLRGLHYHERQADLWYLATGRMQVGLADLRRRDRPPHVETLVFDGTEPASIYIPSGVAHGYLALTEIELIYWVTSEYDPDDEQGVAWDDPELAVPWQLSGDPVLSDRDARNPKLDWELIPSFS
ncbi:MAG: dTDP-4-dehydrorhamnose 3,5-epimerase [Gaiellales bacterium]|jgi:dTDP-4-dehydrorhamnose 3,5-epimerase|nr:dTDP-4-dehydrorhamnose 3,5-epimerase [Gaiellales bacterium]